MAQNNAVITDAPSYGTFLKEKVKHEKLVKKYGPQSPEAIDSANVLMGLERQCANEVGIDIGQRMGM